MQSMTRTQESAATQGALAQAIKAANDKVSDITKAPVTVTPSKDLQAVIGRQTVMGEKILFIVDTHVKNADGTERISFWSAGQNHLKDAPVLFYRQSMPLSQEETQKLAASYGKHMKVQNLILRQRLVKDTHAPRQEDGSISKDELESWKSTKLAQLKAAFDKAMTEAFASM